MNNALARQRSGAKRGMVSRTQSVPAPIGGLNARDSLAQMDPTDAIALDNFVPGTTDCTLRAGMRRWATGLGSASVESLLPYRSGTINKLFGVAGGNIYDATNQGVAPAAQITGLANSRFQYVNFGTPGGQFLCAVNGADPMQVYNGTAWSSEGLGTGATISSITFVGTTATVTTATPHGLHTGNTVTTTGQVPATYIVTAAPVMATPSATTFTYTMAGTPASNATTVGAYTYANSVTGFDTSQAISINSFGSRIWLIQKNTFSVWYLGLNSIAGAATQLDLSSLFRMGGSLVGMITWTVASSNATTQYAVFVSTEGEIIIYQGYDPSNAARWALAGQARIGRPIGGRFWTRMGLEVVLITADGFVPLSKVLQLDRSDNAVAVSNKIDSAARQAIAANPNTFGWQVMLYPTTNKLIINVPTVANSTSYQFVMNTITQAWNTYTGWNANCFETVQDVLYFGGNNGIIYQAEYGTDDDGAAIVGNMIPAFNYFGDRVRKKAFKMVRPTVIAATTANLLIELITDLNVTTSMRSPALTSATGLPVWDVSLWDVTKWGVGKYATSGWQSLGGMGFAASVRFQVTCIGVAVSVENIAYSFEVGSVI
jgi:hypothetical protein